MPSTPVLPFQKPATPMGLKGRTVPGVTPAPSLDLPRVFRGEPLDVSTFTLAERRTHGLATPDTIRQITTDAGLHEVLAYAREKGAVCVDSETGPDLSRSDVDVAKDGLNPRRGRMYLLQIGDTERQYVIWVQRITDWTPIYELFADPAILKMGQNLKFDLVWWLTDHGLARRWWNIADAGLTEQVLGCGLFAEGDEGVGFTQMMTSMGVMARRWLGLSLPKDEDLRTGWEKYTPETLPLEKLLYAADDVIIPQRLLKKQSGWIKRLDLVRTVKLEYAFLPVLADQEVRGIKIDTEMWNALADEAEDKLRNAKRALDRLFDVTVTVEIAPDGAATFSRDKNYASVNQFKDMLRAYMQEHHGTCLIACNKHFKESLIANGFTPERAEKLFAESKVPNPKKPGKNKIVGGPYMTDLCEEHWELYGRYLPKGAVYIGDTDSKTLKLNKIIDATPAHKRDYALPNRTGLPGAVVGPILDQRKYAKQVGTYGRSWLRFIDPTTGRLHASFVQAALATGRTSSKPNCYDAKTEVLTATGWVKFAALPADARVAQVDPHTRAITFVTPSARLDLPYSGDLLALASEQIDLLVTPEHRMLLGRRTGESYVAPATDWVNDRKHFHAGVYEGARHGLHPDHLRFLVALQADGHITPSGAVDFGFTKPRKAERFRDLCERVGVRYREGASTAERFRFYIPAADLPECVRLLGPDKLWGPWLLQQSREALDAFVDELWHWDGCLDRRSHYSSSVRENADWVQTILALSGVRARLRPYSAKSGRTNWQVDTRWQDYSWTTNVTPAPTPYTGRVYCVTVPTGMLLVRRQGADGRVKVSVSGNCQNLPGDKRYRKCFVADTAAGSIFIGSDWDQIEPRIIAQLSDCFTYKRVFFSKHPERAEYEVYCKGVTEFLDLYTEIGKNVGVVPDWMTVLETKGDEGRGIDPLPEGKLGRKQAKIIVLGLGYGTGKNAFYLTVIVDLSEHVTKDFSDNLFDSFWHAVPEVKKTLDALSNLAYPGPDVERKGRIIRRRSPRRQYHPFNDCETTWSETLGGRKRFVRPTSTSYFTTARNQPVQGTGADILKRTMVIYQRWMWDHFDAKYGFVNSIHDEVLVEVPVERADEAYAKLCEVMRQVGESYCPSVPITAAGYIAPYWKKD